MVSHHGEATAPSNPKAGSEVKPKEKKKPRSKKDRKMIVQINNPASNKRRKFPKNSISTTKYNIITFIPKNLFEQFRRFANFYFLVNAILALVPGISPIDPFSAIAPLLFVLSVSAIKELIEDLYRYRADRHANSKKFLVLRNGAIKSLASKKIHVGDMVKITRGQVFPADLVVISSSSSEDSCYVETSNLDGETNLKVRKPPSKLTTLVKNRVRVLRSGSSVDKDGEGDTESSNSSPVKGSVAESSSLSTSSTSTTNSSNSSIEDEILEEHHHHKDKKEGKSKKQHDDKDKVERTAAAADIYAVTGGSEMDYSSYDDDEEEEEGNDENIEPNEISPSSPPPISVSVEITPKMTRVLKPQTSGIGLEERTTSSEIKEDTFDAVKSLLGELEIESPSAEMYRFEGRMTILKDSDATSSDAPHSSYRKKYLYHHGASSEDEHSSSTSSSSSLVTCSLSSDQLLLRGAELRNTQWVYGIVAYTGSSTRLMMNQQGAPLKFSNVEKRLNQAVVMIFIFNFICFLFGGAAGGIWYSNWGEKASYLHMSSSAWKVGFTSLMTYFILFSYMIPISLYVSVEVVRMLQAITIKWDSHLEGPDNVKVNVLNSNLNEECGQVQYLFTDKTGTLTENMMTFKKCVCGSVAFHSLGDLSDAVLNPPLPDDPDGRFERWLECDQFLRLLTLCHSVVPERPGAKPGKHRRRPGFKFPRSTPIHIRRSSVSGGGGGGGGGWDDTSSVGGGGGDDVSSITSERDVPHRTSRRLSLSLHHRRGRRSRTGSVSGESVSSSVGAEPATTPGGMITPATSGGSEYDFSEDGDRSETGGDIQQQSGRQQPEIVYQAQSPDEGALVQGARTCHYTFSERISDCVIVNVNSKPEYHQILAMLEFTSTRRMMSVLCRDSTGIITLYSKGADVSMRDRLIVPRDPVEAARSATNRAAAEKYSHQFAREGLRVLWCGSRIVSEEEWNEWKVEYEAALEAVNPPGGREALAASVCCKMEKDLTLVGCSALEDKLQSFVPQTIKYLMDANIHVWVLTGDKQETAINIAYACQLLTESMTLLKLNAHSVEASGILINEFLNSFKGVANESLALIVDGDTLSYVLRNHQKQFLELALGCHAVVCCRVSPLQKALVVRLVKRGQHATTCAIGDGANDVSMIREAHVGLGISGREGTQAARASDYSIARFHHVRRLLTIHGRYSYVRLTGLVQYSLYKNMCFAFPQLLFSFSSAFSGQSLYESWVMTFFNVVYTFLPPVLYAIFERDVPEGLIRQHPHLYKRYQKPVLLNFKTVLLWLASAIYHACVIYWGAYMMLHEGTSWFANGQNTGLWLWGTLICTCVVVTVNIKLALYSRLLTWLNVSVFLFCIFAYFLLIFILNLFYSSYLYVVTKAFETPRFWLALVLFVSMALFPDVCLKYIRRQLRPTLAELLQEQNKLLPRTSRLLPRLWREFSIAGDFESFDDTEADLVSVAALRELASGKHGPVAKKEEEALRSARDDDGDDDDGIVDDDDDVMGAVQNVRSESRYIRDEEDDDEDESDEDEENISLSSPSSHHGREPDPDPEPSLHSTIQSSRSSISSASTSHQSSSTVFQRASEKKFDLRLPISKKKSNSSSSSGDSLDDIEHYYEQKSKSKSKSSSSSSSSSAVDVSSDDNGDDNGDDEFDDVEHRGSSSSS